MGPEKKKELEASDEESCPLPASPKFEKKGKHCGEEGCLYNNIPIKTLSVAWDQCGKIAKCKLIMQYHGDGKFYLRRESDPDDNRANNTLFSYQCQVKPKEKREEKMVKTEEEEVEQQPTTTAVVKKQKEVKKDVEQQPTTTAVVEKKEVVEKREEEVVKTEIKAAATNKNILGQR